MKLIKISQYVYFLLCVLVLSSLVLGGYEGKYNFSLGIFGMFTLLLVPILGTLIEIIRESQEVSDQQTKTKHISGIIVFLFGVLLILSSGYGNITMILLLGVGVSMYARFDSRLFFVGALLCFAYVSFFLIQGLQSYAEWFSIQAYYFLVAGVVVELAQSLKLPNIFQRNKKTSSTDSRSSEVHILDEKLTKQLKNYYHNYKNILIYGGFIATAVWVLALYILHIAFLSQSMLYILGLYFLVYTGAKIYGFKGDLELQRSDISQSQALLGYILSFIVYIFVLSRMTSEYAITESEILLSNLIGLSLFLLGWFLFFRTSLDVYLTGEKLQEYKNTKKDNKQKKRSKGVYNLMSVLLIIGLIGALSYNAIMERRQNLTQNNNLENISEPTDKGSSMVQDTIDILKETKTQATIGEIYDIPVGLEQGDTGTGVRDLQDILKRMGYYDGLGDGVFDTITQQSLSIALTELCGFPDTNPGVYGTLAKECLDTQILFLY